MTDSPAIAAEHLSKTYREGIFRRRSQAALKGVSFDVRRGEIFGLLGPNGAGKTTFVKIMLGIIRKSGGQATMLGHNAGARTARKQVGYLPEHLRVPRHLNGLSALRYFGKLSGLPSKLIRERQYSVLEMVGLTDRAKDRVTKYSKGMLQRLGLAQALLHSPELLFLDEPTDGLDPVGRSDVRQIIFELKEQGRTIFLNSHLLQEVEMVCDRVAILDQGELRSVGTLQEIMPRGDGFELELELRGDGNQARAAIGQHPIIHPQAHAENHFSVTVELQEQDQVDICIDNLRQHGISIERLARRRISLEDAFLKILSQPRNS